MRVLPIIDKTSISVLLVIYNSSILFYVHANVMINTCSNPHAHILDEASCFCGGTISIYLLPYLFSFLCICLSFLEAAFCPFIFQLCLLNFLRFIAGFAILYQLFYFTCMICQQDNMIRRSEAVQQLFIYVESFCAQSRL